MKKPKFKVGQRVKLANTCYVGRVAKVYKEFGTYQYHVHLYFNACEEDLLEAYYETPNSNSRF